MVIDPEWTEAPSPTSTTSSETPYHKINLRQDASQNKLGLMSWSKKSCIRRESPSSSIQWCIPQDQGSRCYIMWTQAYMLSCIMRHQSRSPGKSFDKVSILADCNRLHWSDSCTLAKIDTGKYMCLLRSSKRFPSLWAFAVWGLFISTEKLMRWIKAKLVTNITAGQAGQWLRPRSAGLIVAAANL